ncbi:MAG: type I methionyl aminopeptidase [Spirochaetes bacterium]|nr:type I methionyl aminopeptidase [Spirochaetota bacterium]NLJ05902.1 type I methionyl aminopeptidase [Exilispira sp.]MBP8991266.1 type I methionyl aminopeptidase [Spirochaetota bacterium]HOV46033.1 type I methionyl aminopeptidase [Exilispira sp.]HPB47622.1 type I methionyl aminopeptidase [Exilispira sp.]
MIFIKTDEQINIMREGGKLLANLLLEIEQLLKPGVCAKDIDMYAYNYIQKVGGKPSFLNYNGFPASICFSINEVLIHGIPTYDMIVKDGDIVSIDAGIIYRGFHTDAARTFIIGDVPEEIKQLVKVTEDSFFEGIKYAKAGNRLSDISSAIEKLIVKNGFFVVREYVGHGVGRSLHEEPSIPNYGKPGNGPILQKGMTLAIEPMVLMKSPRVATKSDGWTVSSTNGLPTAHYENTIVVTNNGPEILTI